MKNLLFALLFTIASLTAAAQTRIALLCDLHVSPGNRNEQILKQVVEEIMPMQHRLLSWPVTSQTRAATRSCGP